MEKSQPKAIIKTKNPVNKNQVFRVLESACVYILGILKSEENNFQRITGHEVPVEASFPRSGTRALA